ncbi:MAG: HAMP domain-containing sensor histidine kinase [Methylococcaceae bacterium]
MGIVLLTTLISIITQTILSDAIMSHTIDQWEKTNSDFYEKSKLPLSIGSKKRADEIIRVITSYPAVIKAGIYDLSGNVLIEKGTAEPCSPKERHAAQNILGGRYELDNQWCFETTVYINLVAETALEYDSPSDSIDEKPIGKIRLWFDKTPTHQLITKIFVVNILIALTIMILVFIIILKLAAHLTRPIKRLSQFMMQAEQGATHVRAELLGPSDIRKMITAFNSMMKRIELDEKTLENQVQLRTHEITEAYRSAQSATEFKSQLLATLSHEMRTPLHGASCYIQLALEEMERIENSVQLDEFLNNALRCTSDLSLQITHLLDYSKNEANKIESTVTTFLPETVLTNAIKTVSPFAKTNNNTIIAEHLSSKEIKTDQEKFSQIILNLLSNAIKFTENGTITVRSYFDEKNYIVSVEDTGCGIPDENLAHIFDAFWQAGGIETRKHRGIGIGLAISKQFSEMIGGEITVQSQVGRGSTFVLSIPQ